MHVLDGAIRYASVEGYKLDLGSMPADVLRRERPTAWPCDGYCLSSAQLGFESSGRSRCLPEIYGRKTFRGPLSSVAPGSLGSLTALVQFLDRVERRLGWQRRATHPAAIDELAQLAADVSKNRFFEDDVERELKASFTAKRARIGAGQRSHLDDITHNRGNHLYVLQQNLQKYLKDIQTDIYYRLEKLRHLGFLTRQDIGKPEARLPVCGWRLSDRYKAEIE